jgi:hypothetical protein
LTGTKRPHEVLRQDMESTKSESKAPKAAKVEVVGRQAGVKSKKIAKELEDAPEFKGRRKTLETPKSPQLERALARAATREKLQQEESKGKSYCVRAPMLSKGKGKGGGPSASYSKMELDSDDEQEFFECDSSTGEATNPVSSNRGRRAYKSRGTSSTGRRLSSTIISSEEDEDAEEDDATTWRREMALFKGLAGSTRRVRGDGFCWLYAILTSMNLLESPETPTPRDYKVAAVFIRKLKLFVEADGCAWMTKQEKKQVLELAEPPVARSSMDNYGGGRLLYRVSAAYLGIPIYTVQSDFIVEEMNKKMGSKRVLVTAATVHGGFVVYNATGRAGR